MKILFDTIEEKEEFIEEHSVYSETDETEIYFCPSCHRKYEDFESCVECCPCSEEEVYGNDDYEEDF